MFVFSNTLTKKIRASFGGHDWSTTPHKRGTRQQHLQTFDPARFEERDRFFSSSLQGVLQGCLFILVPTSLLHLGWFLHGGL
jgi:hypothetical protein